MGVIKKKAKSGSYRDKWVYCGLILKQGPDGPEKSP